MKNMAFYLTAAAVMVGTSVIPALAAGGPPGTNLPEPTSMLLLGSLAAGSLAAYRIKRRKKD